MQEKKKSLTIPWEKFFEPAEIQYLRACFTLVLPLYSPTTKKAPAHARAYPLGELLVFTPTSLREAILSWKPDEDQPPKPMDSPDFSENLSRSVSKRFLLESTDLRTSKTITTLNPSADFSLFWKKIAAKIVHKGENLA